MESKMMIPTERHRSFRVPADEVTRRVQTLQSTLRDQRVALVWIEHLADRLYYTGSAQDGVLFVPADANPVFWVKKSMDRARYEASVETLPYPGGRKMLGALGDRMPGDGRLGVPLDVTPAATYARLSSALGTDRVVDVTGPVRAPRAVKSAWEIEQIRRASDQVTTMYGEIVQHIRPGITELELTGRVEGRLRELGHGGTIRVRRPGADITMAVVVSGVSALYPTSFNGPVGAEGPYPNSASSAGWKRLEEAETVMLDVVTVHNGYHADTTRTFFLGDSVPSEVRRAHDFCLDALKEIEKRLSPGNVCSEVYLEVQRVLEERGEPQGLMGFGENRVKFFGHGVGLELDELPVLAAKIDTVLEPGMVVAVEPKAFLESVGPVGIENTYVVTAGGCEALCDAPLELMPCLGAARG
jgi:Xaa-Pro dipeptidase